MAGCEAVTAPHVNHGTALKKLPEVVQRQGVRSTQYWLPGRVVGMAVMGCRCQREGCLDAIGPATFA